MIGRFCIRMAVPAVMVVLSGCCIPPWHCGPTWGLCPIKSAIFGYGPYGPYAPYGPQPYYPAGPAMYSDSCTDCGPGGQQFLPPIEATPNGAQPGPQLLTPVPTPTEPTEIDQAPANQSSQVAPAAQPVGYWNQHGWNQQPAQSQSQQSWNQQPVQQQSWSQQPAPQQNWTPQPLPQQNWAPQQVNQQSWNQQSGNQPTWNQQSWNQQPMYPAQPTPWVEEPAGQGYPTAAPGYAPNGNAAQFYPQPQASANNPQSAYQQAYQYQQQYPQGYRYQSPQSPNWDRARQATDFVMKLPSRAWEGLKGFAPDRRPRGQMAMAQAAPTSQSSQRHGSPQHLATIAQTLEAQGRVDQAQRIYSQIQAQDSGGKNGQAVASQTRQPQLPPDYDIAPAQPPVIPQPRIQLAGSTNQPPPNTWNAPKTLTAPQMQSTPLVIPSQAMPSAGGPQLVKSAQQIPPSDRFPKLGSEWQVKPESSAGPTYQPMQQVQFIPAGNGTMQGGAPSTTRRPGANATWNSEFQRLFARDGRLMP